MVHGHAHALPPGAGHAAAGYRGRLALTAALTAAFLLLELVAGLVGGSLALVSDAGHMATDVVGLGASWLATHIAARPDRSGRRSYGHYRAEVFASGLAVMLMLGVGGYVLVEAAIRTTHAQQPATGLMALVAAGGLLINLVAMALLRPGASAALNVRAAYLEVAGDAAGSFGVLVAAAAIQLTGRPFWDTVAGAAIGLFVVVRALTLGRHVIAVLAQHVPMGVDPLRVDADLRGVPGVRDVHDLHLWTLTSGMNVATAHLVTGEGADPHPVLDAARAVLAEGHGIVHATLQVEPETHTGCHEIAW